MAVASDQVFLGASSGDSLRDIVFHRISFQGKGAKSCKGEAGGGVKFRGSERMSEEEFFGQSYLGNRDF